MCRWALCYSLKEDSIPTDVPIIQDSNLEMSWFTFGGEDSDLYEALIIAWCQSKDLPHDNDTISKYFKLHLKEVFPICQVQILLKIWMIY